MKFSILALGPLAACTLKRARRDYETRGRLSTRASMAGWALYIAHLPVTLAAALRSTKALPLHRNLSLTSGGSSAILSLWFFAAVVPDICSNEQMSGTETGNLVKSGPYRYSRNPQIVGWGLALFGASIAGRSPKALLLTAAFFLTHRLYFVAEEQHLERSFGEEYLRYKSEVSRFS